MIEGCNVAFDTSFCGISHMPVIGIDGLMTRARLCYTREYLPPDICRLINPAAMAKLMPFPAKSTQSSYHFKQPVRVTQHIFWGGKNEFTF